MAINYTPIPTYIINLEKRKDRKDYIKKEFDNHPHFDIHIVNAIEDPNPAVGLYKSFCSIVKNAMGEQLPFVLICEDDHRFTVEYSFEKFGNYLTQMENYETDVFLGGVSWFEYSIPCGKNLYWVKSFTGAQFLIIYSRFYDRILNTPFHNDDVIDRWISHISDNIYVSVPMLSVQKDFGYSDVTEKNNAIGKVDQLFSYTINRWNALEEIYISIDKGLQRALSTSSNDYAGLLIPTYIINLENCIDRLEHIKKEFVNKKEFDITVVEGCKDKNGSTGLWQSIRQVVQLAMEKKDEVIVICEDNHIFCDTYQKEPFFSCIYRGAYLGADIILGGISSSRQPIVVDEYMCWVDRFQSTQFTIIYSNFFETIFQADFTEEETVDFKLSNMTINKYVIHPFISIQKDFGNSGIPIVSSREGQHLGVFETCANKIEMVRNRNKAFAYMNTNLIAKK